MESRVMRTPSRVLRHHLDLSPPCRATPRPHPSPSQYMKTSTSLVTNQPPRMLPQNLMWRNLPALPTVTVPRSLWRLSNDLLLDVRWPPSIKWSWFSIWMFYCLVLLKEKYTSTNTSASRFDFEGSGTCCDLQHPPYSTHHEVYLVLKDAYFHTKATWSEDDPSRSTETDFRT